MEQKLFNLLQTLKIEFSYQVYEGKANSYLIYSIPNQRFVDYSDDEYGEDDYLITITYWTNELSCLHRYKDVVDLLVKEGFTPQPIQDTYEESYYGKIMKFTLRKEK